MIHYARSEHDLEPPQLIGHGKRGPIYLAQGGSEPASETPPGDTPPKPPETPPTPPTPPVTPPTPPPAPTHTDSGTDGLGTKVDALPERIVSGLREAFPHLGNPPTPPVPPVKIKRTFGERWFGLPAGGANR